MVAISHPLAQAARGNDPWLTEDETARQLRVSGASVRAERVAGRLGFVRVRKRVFYPQSAIDAYKSLVTVTPCQNTNSSDGQAGRTGTSFGPSAGVPFALQRARQIVAKRKAS